MHAVKQNNRNETEMKMKTINEDKQKMKLMENVYTRPIMNNFTTLKVIHKFLGLQLNDFCS